METVSAVHEPAPLSLFTPGVRDWFETAMGKPTAVQAAAWPVIARREHALITAPTGSGKTLTAFLWALDAFAAGRSQPGSTRILYVSPLKALNNDIQRNLLAPLTALRSGGALPAIRAETRSGDTAPGARQRLLRHPPEILITTPESLLLMLSSTRGRLALQDVDTVIIDEIHALVDNRRGTLLFAALERLSQEAGEFQRIALSATVRPLAAVAEFAAGLDASGRPRPMALVAPAQDKHIELDIRFPAAAAAAAELGIKIWEPLAADFRERIARNRSTLLFVNSRRLAERITFKINEGSAVPLAWAHHGSLARDLRLAVEQRLKSGALPAIVATSSLEMGIDIGDLDEVLLIQAPAEISTALQRIGRAGHQVGAVSRASLYPTHPQDFLDAAALARAVAERDIEPVRLLSNPLDVLAQLLVAFTASETWRKDDLFALLRQCGPYRALPREQFDLVIDMLAGRYAGNRIRELKSRLRVDRIRGTIAAERSAVLAYHAAGGVIPDRGYYQLRHADTGATVGELDEEFVWEATTGQVFTLGTQNWQIRRITHNDVLATPTERPPSAPPFWRAESRARSYHFSQRIGAFLAAADTALSADGAAGLTVMLQTELRFDANAAAALVTFLQTQRARTGTALPHATHLVAETVATAPGGYRTPGALHQLVLHTFWGGRVNQPLALALRAALAREGGEIDPSDIEIAASDNAIVLISRVPLEAADLLALVTPANLLALLRTALESSGIFGARFREAAGRALILTRQRFNARLPLWISRLQAKKLLNSVHDLTDFPLLLECWRACLQDEFDLPALTQCLTDLGSGRIELSTVRTPIPSPFAAGLAWAQIQRYMYADDQPDHVTATALSDDLLATVIGDATLRPALRPETVAEFLARRQRTASGYAPESTDEWADWIRERVLLPVSERPEPIEHPDVTRLSLGHRQWWVHREQLQGLLSCGWCGAALVEGPIPPVDDPRTAEQFAGEMLSFYGPLDAAAIAALLPGVPDGLLDDAELLVSGPLLAEFPTRLVYCERQNYEALLRLQRARNRPALKPRPARDLPGFLAAWQGLGATDPQAAADARLALLRGYRAPVEVWLHDLLPPRWYPPPTAAAPTVRDLDQLLLELGFSWRGAGTLQIRIGDPEDLELLTTGRADCSLAALFNDPDASYGFIQLLDRQTESAQTFNARWWTEVWAGNLSADSLQPLREGLARQFNLASELTAGGRRPRPSTRSRARPPRYRHAPPAGWSGYWRLQAPAAPIEDALVAAEDARARARLLLDRYGMLCRELANREGDALRWSALFRALRLMELAGEVLGGYFFEGLSGPQFLTPAALSTLSTVGADLSSRQPADAGDSQEAIGSVPTFWVNAMDPVSPCGLGLPWPDLPQRRPQNYLSFHAGRLTLVIENGGRRLRFLKDPDPTAAATILAPLMHLLQRHQRLPIESIDGQPPLTSPRLELLNTVGRIVKDHRTVWLEPANKPY